VPRIKLTKSAIDSLPTRAADVVYWDTGCPGFGVKVTPKGRKVFLVLYRTGGAGSKLRKYTIGPYGKVTLHQAHVAAQRVFSAKLEGRDLAREKREARCRTVTDRVEGVLETFIAQHVSRNRSALRYPVSFAERSAKVGDTRAYMTSASEISSSLSRRSSSAARLPPPTRR
jgi:Arm DNA-binding domain